MNTISFKNAALFFGLLMIARALLLWGAGAALVYSIGLDFTFALGHAIFILVGFEAIRYDPTKVAVLNDLATIKIYLADLVISSNVQEKIALEARNQSITTTQNKE
jgi:hypothetical protein